MEVVIPHLILTAVTHLFISVYGSMEYEWLAGQLLNAAETEVRYAKVHCHGEL